MTINCESCGKYLGEITIGKIRKGAVLLCAQCEEARKYRQKARATGNAEARGFAPWLFQ